MGETVKVQVEIVTQPGTEAADVDEWTGEIVDGLTWARCVDVEVTVWEHVEVTVWLRTRGERDAGAYAENFVGHLSGASWCLVEEVLTAEPVEE